MAHPYRAVELPFIESKVLGRVILLSPRPKDKRGSWTARISEAVETALQREVSRNREGISLSDRAEAVVTGGYWQTSPWLVDYIAGSLVRDLTDGIPGGADPLIRILDPSCGCGLYLIGVYRALARSGADRTTAVRALHGTDRDPRAVDAAGMLLLLATTEEGHSAAGFSLKERVRWGDPIIGQNLRDEDARRFRGPGAWQHAAPVHWPSVFPGASGGFDGVVGCPPFRMPGIHRDLAVHLQECYRVYPAGDIAGSYYVERGLSLLREGGMLCMALDRKWLRSRSGTGLRRILREKKIRQIVDFGSAPVWGRVAVQGSILCVAAAPPGGVYRACRADSMGRDDLETYLAGHCRLLDQSELDAGGWTLADRRVGRLLERILKRGTPLGRYVMGKILAGSPIRKDTMLIGEKMKEAIVREEPLSAPLFRRAILQENVGRFRILEDGQKYAIVVRDPGELALFPRLPGIFREASSGTAPFICAREAHEGPKVLIAAGNTGIRAALDDKGSYPQKGVIAVPGRNLYLLGILNSRLIRFFWGESGEHEAKVAALARVPVFVVDPYDPAQQALYQDLVRCVREILTGRPANRAGKGIGRLEQEIDRIVYELYGVGEDEISLVAEYQTAAA
jgi:hypothetical protein